MMRGSAATAVLVVAAVQRAAGQAVLGMSGDCDMDALVIDIIPVQTSCCGWDYCATGPPTSCSETCAPVFLDFMQTHRACSDMMESVVGDLEDKCGDPDADVPAGGEECSSDAAIDITMICATADPGDAQFCEGECYRQLDPFLSSCQELLPGYIVDMMEDWMGDAMALVADCDRDETCDTKDICAGKGELKGDTSAGISCTGDGVDLAAWDPVAEAEMPRKTANKHCRTLGGTLDTVEMTCQVIQDWYTEDEGGEASSLVETMGEDGACTIVDYWSETCCTAGGRPAECDPIDVGVKCSQQNMDDEDDIEAMCLNPCIEATIACLDTPSFTDGMDAATVEEFRTLQSACGTDGGMAHSDPGDGICSLAIDGATLCEDTAESIGGAESVAEICADQCTQELLDCIDNPLLAESRDDILPLQHICLDPLFEKVEGGDGICELLSLDSGCGDMEGATMAQLCAESCIGEMVDCMDSPELADSREDIQTIADQCDSSSTECMQMNDAVGEVFDEDCCATIAGVVQCQEGPPTVCNHECASVFVPFMDQCGDTMGQEATDMAPFLVECRAAMGGKGKGKGKGKGTGGGH